MSNLNLTTRNLLIGSLITSLVGGFLTLVLDFGGHYYGGAVRVWEYINVFNLFASPLILVISGSLFFVTYLSYLGIRSESSVLTIQQIRLGLILSVIALVVTIIGMVIVIVIGFESDDWWLDTGFFGAILGSGLSTVFMYMVWNNSK